jgi:hypothetical protein
LKDGKNKHNKYDFDHIVFRRKFGIEELIGIMMFSIVIMDKVFDDIEEDKSNERGEEEMAGKVLVSITEVKHDFLFFVLILF